MKGCYRRHSNMISRLRNWIGCWTRSGVTYIGVFHWSRFLCFSSTFIYWCCFKSRSEWKVPLNWWMKSNRWWNWTENGTKWRWKTANKNELRWLTHCRKDPELPLTASKSDDALPPLPPPPPSSCRNAQLRKQRSTSMDAIMFLELLEDEIKDMPTCALKSDARDVAVLGTAAASKSSKIDDKFKKPRISKGLLSNLSLN